MNALFLSSRSALMFLFTASITACFAAAFSPTTQLNCITTKNDGVACNNKLFLRQHRTAITFPSTTMLHAAEDDNNTGNNNNNMIDSSRVIENDLGLEIIRGTGLDNAEEISEQTWEEIEQGAPSKLMVLKNVSL